MMDFVESVTLNLLKRFQLSASIWVFVSLTNSYCFPRAEKKPKTWKPRTEKKLRKIQNYKKFSKKIRNPQSANTNKIEMKPQTTGWRELVRHRNNTGDTYFIRQLSRTL